MEVKDFSKAIDKINSITRYGNKTGVECSAAMLSKLKNPEENFKIIHVAGTNGKGSVSNYIYNALRELGYKVGLFTSPHLIKENERIRINGKDISDEDFVINFNEVEKANDELINEGFGSITYFDYFFNIAMLYFSKENVNFAVVETGLGGTYDSTNAVQNPILSVITSISLEHTAILGNTIKDITSQKAGIIKSGVPVVYFNTEGSKEVITEKAKVVFSKAVSVDKSHIKQIENTVKYIDFSIDNMYYKNDVFRVNTVAVYQIENAALALTALAVLKDEGFLGEIKKEDFIENVRKGIANTFWEGRMECIRDNIYIDGAHNPDGIKAFIQSAKAIKQYTDKPLILLFSVVGEKNYDNMIKMLCSSDIFSEYIITAFESDRCANIQEVKYTFEKYTSCQIYLKERLSEALELGLEHRKENDGIMLCSGSLYLIGAIREYLL